MSKPPMLEHLNDPEDKHPKYADDDLVNQAELARALRTSRWTVRRWQEFGYEFQFGSRTTPAHCRAWLEVNKHRFKRKPTSPEGLARVRAVLARVHETKRKAKAQEVFTK
jgi:tRNA nucleotidyltransferase/poly(A) polymerase